jgi:tetratricopeptide (TPR) repeat protein
MKKIFLFLPLIWLASCNRPEEPKATFINKDSLEKIQEARNVKDAPAREELLKQIEDLEKELYASETLNEEKAKKMISLYELYYQNYHKYPETPDFLFKAGEITENISQPYRAINFYTRCYEEYPAFKYSAECLFRMANLYDYKLGNYIKAKALYEEVKVQFPKSPLAKDADAAIRLMNKSDQDMIREFEKKNGVKK